MSTIKKIYYHLIFSTVFLLSFCITECNSVSAKKQTLLNREIFPASKFGKINLRTKHFIREFLKEKPFSALSALSPEGKLRKLSRPIGRLDVLYRNNMSTCTAFLFHQHYIMTNQHCVDGKPKKIIFRLEYAFEGQPHKARSFDIDVEPVEINKQLDYAILRVSSGDPGLWSGRLKLSYAKIQDDQKLLLIGHPAGLPKMLSGPDDCYIINRDLGEIHRIGGSKVFGINYSCSSVGGSSGSPILDKKTGEVIALNHSSNKTSSMGTPISVIAKVSPLVRDILKAREAASRGCFVFNDEEVCGGTLQAKKEIISEKGVLATIVIAAPFKTQACDVPVNVNCQAWEFKNKEFNIKVLKGGGYDVMVDNSQVFKLPRNKSYAKLHIGKLLRTISLSKDSSVFQIISRDHLPGRKISVEHVTKVKFKIENNKCRLINTSFMVFTKPKVPNWHKHFKVRKVKPRYCKILN